MDAETNALLKALVDGQIKLAEGQAKLFEGQARTDVAIRQLVEGQAKLFEGQVKMEASIECLADKVSVMAERLDSFGERLDSFGAQVVRGFTEAAHRNGDLDRRVSRLEAEVESLKKQPR